MANNRITAPRRQFKLVGGEAGEPARDYNVDPPNIIPLGATLPPDQSWDMNGGDEPSGDDDIPAQPTPARENGEISYFEGYRVVVGVPYDMQRFISIGNARINDITGQMTVGGSVELVRSPESKRVLDDAVSFASRVQADLRTLIGAFKNNGAFDLARTTCLNGLRQDQKRSVTQELTNLLKGENDLDEAAIEKKLKAIAWRHAKAMRLPAFLWTGKFGVRNNTGILTPSGLMCIDLDKLAVDIQELMASLSADPLVFWAARSPSGTGVKLLVRIPDDAAQNDKKYLACFETVERYLASKYPGVSMSVDKQAKAVAQLCFFMHDPESVCNPGAYILQPDEDLVSTRVDGAKSKKEKKASASRPAVDSNSISQQKKVDALPQPVRESKSFPFDAYPPEKQWETVRSAVDSMEDYLAALPPGEGKRNYAWTRIGLAFGEWLKTIDDESISEEARDWLLELAAELYPGDEGAVERAMDASNGSSGLGTLFQMAKENGNWTAPWAGGVDDDPKRKWTIIEHVNEFQSRVPTMRCVHDRWYAEENGLWKPVEQQIYQPIALDVLPAPLKSSKRATEVMTTFQQQQQVPRQLLRTASIWENETRAAVLINCRNGLLRVTASSAELIPYDPNKYYFTGQLTAAYDPNACAAVFERVLVEAQPSESARKVLVWWFGYSLYPGLRFRLSLINFGPSTTGKSTIWEYGIGAVMGGGVKKNLSLSDICSTTGYSIPGLEHAPLNVGGELDADELAQSSRFKLLVGGEPLEVRGIYGRPFTMTDYVVKLVFLTNHLPRFRSGTDAELRRIQFVCWDKVPAKPDPKLPDLIMNERDGALTHWMVPALQSILGGLEPVADDQTIRNEFAVRNDPMKVFLDECCLLDVNAKIEKDVFRRTFRDFVEKADLPNGLTEDSVCGRLLIERTHGKVSVRKERAGANRRHFYIGVKFRPEFEKESTGYTLTSRDPPWE